jgi:hypothetical protein
VTNYSRETADRFESAARQPGQDFTDVYSSIVAMQQSSRDMHSYVAQISTTNLLLQQRGLSDFDGDGSADLILGARNGLIITADPRNQLIQARDRNFRVVAEQAACGLPSLSLSEQGRDTCFGERRHHDRRRDRYRERREEPYPSQQSEQPPPLQVEQPPQQVEQPPQQGDQPPAQGEQQTPHAEQWGSREFTVNSDGSAEYSVKSGDTVWDISTDVLRRQLGREPSGAEIVDQVQRIATASGLADANLIYPGDKLTIPAAGDTSAGRQARPVGPVLPNDYQPPSDGNLPSEQDPPSDQVTPPQGDVLPPPRRDGLPRHSNGNRASWYISQVGDDKLRSDGWFGCGPTSLLMGLADWGVMEPTEANRKQLIQDTGTLAAGQFPGDVQLISTWAKNKGLQSEYSRTKPDIEGMDRAIAEGKTLVVNGSMLGRDGKTVYPHFVYIAGRDANGNYILGDPAQSTVETWTREQLYAFVTRGSNPPGYATLWR